MAEITPRSLCTDSVEAALPELCGLVPPIPVELRTPLQVQAIEILGPGIPAPRPRLASSEGLRLPRSPTVDSMSRLGQQKLEDLLPAIYVTLASILIGLVLEDLVSLIRAAENPGLFS